MAMISREQPDKQPGKGTSKVKFPDSSRPDYDLGGSNFGSLLAGVGLFILFVWLIGGIVALFFGSAGGQWGWGFGFGWYLSLLAAVVVGMAGVGIIATFKICLRR